MKQTKQPTQNANTKEINKTWKISANAKEINKRKTNQRQTNKQTQNKHETNEQPTWKKQTHAKINKHKTNAKKLANAKRSNMKEIIEMNNKSGTNKTTNAGRTTSNKREIKEGETNEVTKQQTQDASTSKTQCFLSFSLKQTNSGQSNAKQTPNKRRRNRQNIQVASTRRKHHNERPILSFSFPNEAWHVVWNKHSPRGKFLSLACSRVMRLGSSQDQSDRPPSGWTGLPIGRK